MGEAQGLRLDGFFINKTHLVHLFYKVAQPTYSYSCDLLGANTLKGTKNHVEYY
jgi:hypothetical protein